MFGQDIFWITKLPYGRSYYDFMSLMAFGARSITSHIMKWCEFDPKNAILASRIKHIHECVLAFPHYQFLVREL